MIEARGPENLPPAPHKQCETKGRDVEVADPPGCGTKEPCRPAWLLCVPIRLKNPPAG